MHSITLLEEPRGLEELPEPLAGAEGTRGIDSSGGGEGRTVARETTGTRDGGAQKTRSTHTVPG